MPLNNACAETKNRHRARRSYHRTTLAMLARWLARSATTPPQATAFAARFASPRTMELPLCAHAQGQSRVRACRTVLKEYAAPAARGMQTEMPPKQAALARQVRQRMNRLGKPEHRARFCFFSKKKSLAGTRRFPITPEIKIRMGFNRSTLNPRSPKTLLQPPPLTGAKHHRTTPRYPRPLALCATASR